MSSYFKYPLFKTLPTFKKTLDLTKAWSPKIKNIARFQLLTWEPVGG
jgi:hypothetical protein